MSVHPKPGTEPSWESPELRTQRRPKVLHYCFDYPGRIGGIERYVQMLCEQLQARHHFEPVIICHEGSLFHQHLKAAGLTVRGVPPFILSNSIFASLDLRRYWHLRQILKQEKPDLVHVHWGRLEHRFFKLQGYPLIYTFHSYGAPFNLSMIENPSKRWLVRQTQPLFRSLVPHLDALLFVSRAEQERMHAEGFLPPDILGEVLHNGVPVKQIRRRAKQVDVQGYKAKLGLNLDALVVSFICRLDDDKNALAFIDLAERLLASANRPIQFLVAGNGFLVDAFQQKLAQSPAGPHTHYLGYREDVAELLALSDLTVSVSLQEGFGLRIVEALAAGTPVLTFAAGGINDILDFPAAEPFLAPVGDMATLGAKGAAFLQLSAEERHQLAAPLLQRADDFDIDTFVDRMEAVYSRILKQSLRR
jgi:glycosyltransferase involved in cell wall biosynthesis